MKHPALIPGLLLATALPGLASTAAISPALLLALALGFLAWRGARGRRAPPREPLYLIVASRSGLVVTCRWRPAWARKPPFTPV